MRLQDLEFKNGEWVPMKITYTVDIGHPDIKPIMQYVEENKIENGILEFEDEYLYKDDYSVDAFILNSIYDLKLVVGGGSITSHIHNIKIYIKDKILEW